MIGNQDGEELKIIQRRKVVAERYMHGETQRQIAIACEVSQSTVCNDLAAMRAEWLAAAAADLSERQAVELARLDNLERTYWEAWERSCQPRESKRNRLTVGTKGDSEEVTEENEKRDGDPRFLDGVFKCIAKRCDIFGLVKVERETASEKAQGSMIGIRIVEIVKTTTQNGHLNGHANGAIAHDHESGNGNGSASL